MSYSFVDLLREYVFSSINDYLISSNKPDFNIEGTNDGDSFVLKLVYKDKDD